MKKMVLVTAGLLSFFIIIMKSDAEMKITPSGVTSPDDSAALHLSGGLSTGNDSNNPDGALISGVNTYSGQFRTYGGYFESAYLRQGRLRSCYRYLRHGRSRFCLRSLRQGVYGYAFDASGMGVYGVASSTGDGVHYGGHFFAAGSGTGGNYGPFTGAHEVKFAGTLPGEIVPGMIVSVTGKTEARKDKNGGISLSSTLPTVTISTKARDKAVFGVIVSDGPLPEDHWYETQEGERFGVVNALGEGRVWVTGFNGQVQAGDYITTSFVQGYGQLQDDDLLHSCTLGKAIETIDWDQVAETVQHDGKTYKRYLIAVVYTSG